MRTQCVRSPGLNFTTVIHPKDLLKYASLLHHYIVSSMHLLKCEATPTGAPYASVFSVKI